MTGGLGWVNGSNVMGWVGLGLHISGLGWVRLKKIDYVSSCGIPLMPVMYQVVGFGWGDGRHSGSHRRSVSYRRILSDHEISVRVFD